MHIHIYVYMYISIYIIYTLYDCELIECACVSEKGEERQGSDITLKSLCFGGISRACVWVV